MTDDLDLILQRDVRRKVIPEIGRGQWVTVHDELGWASGIYSALIPDAGVKEVLTSPGWELCKGDGGREVARDVEQGHTYSRHGGPFGVEPIVLARDFHNVRPDDLELSEEYRLFHNLFHDRARGEFIRIMEDGSEDIVGRIQGNRWELRIRDLRQYLAIRRMHLAVYFQVCRTSAIALDQLPVDELREQFRDELTCYDYGAGAEESGIGDPGVETFSKTVGKKLIRPQNVESCGIWPYEAEDSFESFIIGTDEAGKNVEHSCDPGHLADYFGKNKGAPHYLKPVFFRRSVLTRYYANPTKYTVRDGRLQCASMWSLHIDNNLENLVSVALGDLGRDLPAGERLHWKAHNVPPEGAGISGVNYRRNFLAEWSDAEAPDLVFKAAYGGIHIPWESHFGWRLFRPLHKDDEHCLGALRRLLAEEQAEFDEQVKNLTKLLVDSLNEKAIQAELPTKVEGERGIAKFARWLERVGQPNADSYVAFLKDLQAVRSRGAAHAKGSGYEDLWKRLGYEGRALTEVLDEILGRGARMLGDLRAWAESSAPPGA